MSNKSKERAFEIIKYYVDQISKLPFIKSIILDGSLSDDTYTGNKGSDIDIVNVIESNNYYEDKLYLLKLIEDIENFTNKDIPISKVVYNYSQLFHPYYYNFDVNKTNKDLIELPIEVLRIKYSGKTLYGEDIISVIDQPTKEDVLYCKELNQQLLMKQASENPKGYSSYLETIKNPPMSILCQIVITTAMEDYFLVLGKNCSSKRKILECIEKDWPQYEKIELLRICHKYRVNNSLSKEEEILSNKLYREFFVS